MKILFMGTPDFAVSSLKRLTEEFEVAAVVTQTDKKKGRGYIMTPSPVKEFALSKSIPVYQPETLKNDAILPLLSEIVPDAVVVVAFGKILPLYVLNFPKFGCINLHASLLPEYRGAAPMQRAIMDGKDKTGVTTMYMAEGLDTGDILETAQTPIYTSDNFESIHDRLALLGANLIVSTLKKLESGELTPRKQDDSKATYAAKIEKSDCLVNFSSSVNDVHNKIRGLSPYPLSYAFLNQKTVKFISSQVVSNKTFGVPAGTVLSLEDRRIQVACPDGVIAITSLLPEGKSRMSAFDFINGRNIKVGDRFTCERQN